MKAPNLHEYMAKFGGYDKITPEGWAEWDRLNREWQQWRRDQLLAERRQSKGSNTEMPDTPMTTRVRDRHGRRILGVPSCMRAHGPCPEIWAGY